MEGLFWETSLHLCVVYSPAFSVNNHCYIYEETQREGTGAARLSKELQYMCGCMLLCVHKNLFFSPLVCFSWIRGSGRLASSWSARSRPVCWQAVWRWHRVLSTTQTQTFVMCSEKISMFALLGHISFKKLFPVHQKNLAENWHWSILQLNLNFI